MAYDEERSRFDFQFTQARPFQTGDILLGFDWEGQLSGYPAETHCMGIAGTGGGKTTAIMIPNIAETPDNVFCIDPTGKVVEAVAEHRAAEGFKVFVIDPFGKTGLDPATYNPLRTGDLAAVMKAMVVRHDPKSEHWDAGAEVLLRGLTRHLMTAYEAESQTLGHVRAMLRGKLDKFLEEMADSDEPEVEAAVATMSVHPSEAGHFKSAALQNTAWLDTAEIRDALQDGELDFRNLKTEKMDVYVVLPIDELEGQGRFLRLLVSAAINAMLKTQGPRRCLFLLDEFFALGKLDIMLKAFAAGRSAGIRCFPFVQDMGQLELLYGKPGMRSFLGSEQDLFKILR